MEVILREDVENLGARGEIVRVAAGYARNFLLPKKLAVTATDSNKKIIELERGAWLRKEAKLEGEAQELAKLLNAVTVTIKQKAGENDQLFGSVTSKDIADAIEKRGADEDSGAVDGRADQLYDGEDSHAADGDGGGDCRGGAFSGESGLFVCDVAVL